MIIKKRTVAILAIASSFFLIACQATKSLKSGDAWGVYQKQKSITVGFDNTFVPMGYKDESGKCKGFDIDLAKEVFHQYGLKVNFQAINWDMKEAELNNGKIDVIWNGYSITKERQDKVAFTDSYMRNEQIIVVKKRSDIKTISDMKHKVLGAQSASSGYDALLRTPKMLKDFIKNKDANQYETFTQAFIDLKSDRIDGILIDKVYANYYLAKEGQLENYRMIPTTFENEAFSVGLRKEDKTLQAKINRAFRVLYQNGKFQAISEKWFGDDVATANIKS
ncbi:TPA: amino acid ABC transporter substrate-binding protein [Streptococcus pyogenes]|nr:amino acid ABC transporter substrate-binding protein [Streptococcus pyogenes]